MKRVSTIAPKVKAVENEPLKARLKVCAYCRVSSSSIEQMASYEAQVDYYIGYIQQNAEWEFVGIYADEGISGTRKKSRVEFSRMLKDAKAGRINLVITKSISRFARNTADCLETVRFLKDLGIAVFFERENINTLSAESELLLSVLSSIAQEESRSISENLKWAYQKRFQQGKVVLATSRFLGYDLGDNGELVINETEAEIVKRIFREYLAGISRKSIIQGLERDQIKTMTGLKRWQENTIRNILTNEKYCGDVILQKTYIADYLTHRKKKNNGELPMYRISGNHQAIIAREDFDLVQRLLADRAAEHGNLPGGRDKYARQYAFSGKLVCGHCGYSFKRRTWNSKENSKQIVWQCSTYIKAGKSVCSMKALDDVTLKAVFIRVFNKLYNDKSMLKQFLVNVEKALQANTINGQHCNLAFEEGKIIGQMTDLIRKQIKGMAEPVSFQAEYEKLKKRLEEIRSQKDSLGGNENNLAEVKAKTQKIAKILEGRINIMEDFDEEICSALVERVKVLSPTHLVFELKNGLSIEQKFIKRKGINGLQ